MKDCKKTRVLLATGQCRYIKPDRTHCRANARHGSAYCFFHDPDSALEREAARKNGGKERSRRAAVLPSDTPDRSLNSAADVTTLLSETINQVRRGEVDPRISNAIGYLAGILLKAKEKDEIEQRVARLESIIAGQQMTPNVGFEPERSSVTLEFVNPQPPGGQA
ncbi:MAG TPA: hypothetical protein VFO39_22990 [Candidatus Sulfotelmatobacter sp.]|nr:hypothetical protein [Candidatus Sulfotelmatobacter sp.]